MVYDRRSKVLLRNCRMRLRLPRVVKIDYGKYNSVAKITRSGAMVSTQRLTFGELSERLRAYEQKYGY